MPRGEQGSCQWLWTAPGLVSQLKQGSESPWPLARRGLESKDSASGAGWPTGQSMVQGDQLALAVLWDRGK